MDEAEYCDRLGLIYRGELIALGTPHELKAGMTAPDDGQALRHRWKTCSSPASRPATAPSSQQEEVQR